MSDGEGGMVRGKAVLVTGAARGIGREAALLFAREGARVLVCDLEEEVGETVVWEIENAGGEAAFARVDVCDEAQVEAAVATCRERFGAIDCAMNNAGIAPPPALLHETEAATLRRVLDVNLLGVFFCLKHEIRAMLEGGGGAIVNTASGAGLVAVPGMSPYCASKHAVLGLTRTAAAENARTNIRVNAICPGSIDTDMLRASMMGSPQVEKMILASQPGGRLGRPEEVAEAAVWLCSDRASFVSGESMLVDAAAICR